MGSWGRRRVRYLWAAVVASKNDNVVFRHGCNACPTGSLCKEESFLCLCDEAREWVAEEVRGTRWEVGGLTEEV